MYVGQKFDDFKSSKAAMQDWALLPDPHKFTLSSRFKISDKTRNTAVYVYADSTGCLSEVSATYTLAKECVTEIGIEEEHNCTGVQLVERSSKFSAGFVCVIKFTFPVASGPNGPWQLLVFLSHF